MPFVTLVSLYDVDAIPVAIGVVLSPPDAVPRYTLYPVIVDPPLEDGAVHDNDTFALPPVACKFCGADGAVEFAATQLNAAVSVGGGLCAVKSRNLSLPLSVQWLKVQFLESSTSTPNVSPDGSLKVTVVYPLFIRDSPVSHVVVPFALFDVP